MLGTTTSKQWNECLYAGTREEQAELKQLLLVSKHEVEALQSRIDSVASGGSSSLSAEDETHLREQLEANTILVATLQQQMEVGSS